MSPRPEKRRVSIFGATGSIGQNTIDLIARAPEAYDVVALTGARNIAQLAADARRLSASIAVTAEEELLPDLRAALEGSGVEAAAGEAALLEAADRPADWIMSAIVGAAGLAPGFRALRHGTTLALANKESLVTAGPLLLAEAATHGATILPVDSEHSAVFQALVGEDIAAVERIIITASGGGLRDWPEDDLARATPADAGAHPNWDMGQRITIDSASMFNKAMELIETKEFFGVSPARIEAVVHPQSLIHALVGFTDGALMAHLGPPDMRHAIGYALNYPDRAHLPVDRLDLAQIARLEFHAPSDTRYPALKIAREVMQTGGQSGCIFNAAKEIALDGFLAGKIGFMDMSGIVSDTLDAMSSKNSLSNAPETLEDVLQTDQMARNIASARLAR
ncbi:1-deoxy-D-xylulose-5-phosphate reductoisomerase [Jannaschia sp. CCS1]|uniref:1-deoxy-D-xylulose 5-phosphate reductoisomerase n=1 Tax=Jannaschia sp. (strain CCS1) TaxID=290400 RepID=DXR_JANSC|nr:1-deoxy-D-xylulose-5-phosphate reductoisomerase [Jannaschia sp. CCS1]Q28PJ0.1 RecName: Full=1-deoxy-D-xylulose 5-phosphate reductoisomerase; Short=DXP reductoisomerase; AltName: Full=1-deoxyxylulose-5-phosphate reductoisomerase; AltName: Full=2-C-methyl-D-erythritol 4-phosphate synthase [Jannaschia sp. CCS1]ABD55372.1 1-deoxy-D-xylulose 5-phosphate reductoisomerase [Jannaschia sp. CCS1]